MNQKWLLSKLKCEIKKEKEILAYKNRHVINRNAYEIKIKTFFGSTSFLLSQLFERANK